MSFGELSAAAMADLATLFAPPLNLPELRLARQQRSAERLDDVPGAVRRAMRVAIEAAGPKRGRIAVGVGSRGIANIRPIVTSVVTELRNAGFEPFVVPAMGSHGGGTPAGQVEVLESYGIAERTLGVPVLATSETTVIGEVAGLPVAIDRHVVEAGAAFLVNRIKPHTDFRGPIESGICKMAAIGLSKQAGARSLHALGPDGLRDVMPEFGRLVARTVLVGGLAIVENEFDETMRIEALRPEDVGGERESALLELARAALPRVPFGELDVLVIERIGKDISGTGLDPNVTGRWAVGGLREPEPLPVRCIVALRLTAASHGNALGIGLVDFVSRQLADDVDLVKTYVNGLTSGWSGVGRTRLPIVLGTDRDAIATAASVSGRSGDVLRLAWIQDTLHTRTIGISEGLWAEARADAGIELSAPFRLAFGDDGALVPLAEREAELAAGSERSGGEQGGLHAAGVRGAAAGDVEGRPVIDRGPDDR